MPLSGAVPLDAGDLLKVLDLFCGLGGFSQAFVDRGHTVVRVDRDWHFSPDILRDMMVVTAAELADRGPFDIILASPPCERFSVAAIGKNWTPPPENAPKSEKAVAALELVRHTLRLIEDLNPRRWVLENPRGKLRRLIDDPATTIWLCQYGDTRGKPTDFWGNLPPWFKAKGCRNGSTDHASAPRGSKTPGSTQGIKGSPARALLPYGLSLALCVAMERDLKL